MINNFEKETAPLTEEEKKIAILITSHVQFNIGERLAVTNKEMVIKMKTLHDIKLSEARLRKIIHHIRTTGMVQNLIATSKGYYVEIDAERISTYVDSLVQRAEAIYRVARSYNTGLFMHMTLGPSGPTVEKIKSGVCCEYCVKHEVAGDCPVIHADPWSRFRNYCNEFIKKEKEKPE
jgi:hypothetical protein